MISSVEMANLHAVQSWPTCHNFPRNPKLKEKWISATGKQDWIPSKVATICSDHFEPRHFVQKTGERRYLHVLAVPSRNVHSLQGEQQLTMVASSPDVDISSSAGYIDTSPLLFTSLAHGRQLNPATVFSSPAVPTNHDVNSSESNNEVTSIEVEIMPENSIILRPRDNTSLLKPDVNMNSQTREEDRRVMELMRAKIREQDLLIRKLNVRNCRLKKRLFSLKSMEATES